MLNTKALLYIAVAVLYNALVAKTIYLKLKVQCTTFGLLAFKQRINKTTWW